MTFIAYLETCYVLFSLIHVHVVLLKVALLMCQKVS